ncbi:hypothetical protein MAH4_23650 [Sessilibacter sp. MAH4]
MLIFIRKKNVKVEWSQQTNLTLTDYFSGINPFRLTQVNTPVLRIQKDTKIKTYLGGDLESTLKTKGNSD